MATSTYTVPATVSRYQRNGLIAAVVGLGLTLVGLLVSPTQFFHSYFLGYLLYISMAVGCLGLLALQYVTGGGWGILTRRICEAGGKTIPFGLVLMLPVLFAMPQIFPWLTTYSHEAHVISKSGYLNQTFFLIRVVIYFIFFTWLAYTLSKYGAREDATGDFKWTRKLENLGGGGLLFWFLAVTFMSVDWISSLIPQWYSTMFAFIMATAVGLDALAFATIIIILLAKEEPLKSIIKPVHLHDLGKLLFAFDFLWGYLCFSQYLITYSGNLPEDIIWYAVRTRGGWELVAYLVIIAHFVLPFILLLSRDLKRNGKTLIRVTGLLLVMRVVDLYWYVEPTWHQEHFYISWMDVTSVIGFFGLFVYLWAMFYKKAPMLPLQEPELEAALHPKGAH